VSDTTQFRIVGIDCRHDPAEGALYTVVVRRLTKHREHGEDIHIEREAFRLPCSKETARELGALIGDVVDECVLCVLGKAIRL
jgi:hypothetical protein